MSSEKASYNLSKSFLVTVAVVFLAYFSFKYTTREYNSKRLENVLSSLLRAERSVPIPTHFPIAVGFGSCLDLLVDGIPLMNALGIKPPENATYKDSIQSMGDIAEMFAFFLSEGAAAERYIPSELLNKLVETADGLNESWWKAGGNAPVISNRFAVEGFSDVYVGAVASERFNALYPSKLKFVAGTGGTKDDIHLILEYKVGETWGNYTVSRANRFVLHSDQINPYIKPLEEFGDIIKNISPRLVVLAGLQMLDNYPFEFRDREDRLEELSTLLQSLPTSSLSHFEMASFAELEMMKGLMTYVFPYVDSLGMNEQELPNLLSMCKHGKIIEVADANPRTAIILDGMREIYEYYQEHSARGLTRIHVHTLAFQAILIKRSSQWKNSKAASARSSLTAHRHVCGVKNIDVKNARLIMDDSFAMSLNNDKRVIFNETSSISCWNEDELEFCVAPVLVCTDVKQTISSGDNITPAGLMPQI